MHSFTQEIVAAERERQVAHSATHMGPWQIFFNPSRGPDEVESIAVVLLHTGGNGQHIGVEYDIAWLDARLLCQKLVGAPADFYLALVGGGLSLFVKRHDHHGRSVLINGTRVTQKDPLALFQGYRVDHTLALHTFEGRLYHIETRRIDHPGDAGHLGVAGHEVQKVGHLLFGIQQSIVHVDVYQAGSVAYLLAGYPERLIVLLLVDKA